MKLMILAALLVTASLPAHASPLYCEVGKAVYMKTGFGGVHRETGLSCPRLEAACVDDQLCEPPQPPPPLCPPGSNAMTVSKGFRPVAGTRLACPIVEVACVDMLRCPHPVPIRCPGGSMMDIVYTGFAKTQDPQLSCPTGVAACVNQSRCPSY